MIKKIAVSSPLGDPFQLSTWSAAPKRLCDALRSKGIDVVGIDSSAVSTTQKALATLENLWTNGQLKGISWTDKLRRVRSNSVSNDLAKNNCNFVLSTSTLDVPLFLNIPYYLWIDNSWNLLIKNNSTNFYSKRFVDSTHNIESLVLRSAKKVFTFSQFVAQDIIINNKIPAEQVKAVGCGCWEFKINDTIKNYKNGKFLFVAKQLFSEKGGELVIESFKCIRSHHPDVSLTIVGGSEVFKKAETMDGITVLPFVNSEVLEQLYKEASFLIQPMLYDPWGQVYLEAMRARTLIIALNRSALPELTNGGNTGFLSDQPTARSIAQLYFRARSLPADKLNDMADQAQQYATSVQNWESVAQRIINQIKVKKK